MKPAHGLLMEAQEDLIFGLFFSKKTSNLLPLHQSHCKDSKLIFVQYKQIPSATSLRIQGFFLCLSLSRSSLFIHTDLLACLPDFLFVGMHHSWAWRWWIHAHHLGKNQKKQKNTSSLFFPLCWIGLETMTSLPQPTPYFSSHLPNTAKLESQRATGKTGISERSMSVFQCAPFPQEFITSHRCV